MEVRLVPEGRDGLLLSGTNIARSHEAHASCRVQSIALHIGVSAGLAAAACVRRRLEPRRLDVADIQPALGVGPMRESHSSSRTQSRTM